MNKVLQIKKTKVIEVRNVGTGAVSLSCGRVKGKVIALTATTLELHCSAGFCKIRFGSKRFIM
jgi:hypothetical protein